MLGILFRTGTIFLFWAHYCFVLAKDKVSACKVKQQTNSSSKDSEGQVVKTVFTLKIFQCLLFQNNSFIEQTD